MTAVARRIEPVRVAGAVHEDPGDRPCDGWGRRHDGRAGECCCRAVGHVVWLTPDWGRVESRSACGRHLAIARAAGGCLTFPYGQLPPPSVLMPAVNAEIRRRQRPQPQNFRFAPTGTASFGGMRWTINFGQG